MAPATLDRLVGRALARHGDRPCVTFYDDERGERVELSYRTFGNWVAKVANLLVEELGVGQGDLVATVIGTHWQASVVAFACWRAGAAVVPLDPQAPAARKAAALERARPAALFVREEWLDEVHGLPPAARPPAVVALPASLFGGAGTTLGGALDFARVVPAMADLFEAEDHAEDGGALVLPLGGDRQARLTRGNLAAGAEATARRLGLAGSDRLLAALPAHPANGPLLAHLTAFAVGAGVVLQRSLHPAAFWPRVAAEKVSVVAAVPGTLRALLDAGGDPALEGSPLRAVACAGPAGLAEVAEAWARHVAVPLWPGYAPPEATWYATLGPGPAPATGRWLGYALDGVELAVLDPGGAELPDGSEGELALRGPSVASASWLRPGLRAMVVTDAAGRRHLFAPPGEPGGAA